MARLSDAEAARWAGLYKPSRPFVTKRYGMCLGCGQQIREGSPARFCTGAVEPPAC
jgi:hypothetical protein